MRLALVFTLAAALICAAGAAVLMGTSDNSSADLGSLRAEHEALTQRRSDLEARLTERPSQAALPLTLFTAKAETRAAAAAEILDIVRTALRAAGGQEQSAQAGIDEVSPQLAKVVVNLEAVLSEQALLQFMRDLESQRPALLLTKLTVRPSADANGLNVSSEVVGFTDAAA